MFSFPRNFDPWRAAVAGAAASALYAAEMYVDIAVTDSQFDDLQLIEGLMRGRKARIPALGMAIHLLNGAALGEVYALVEPHLPGPTWLKGLIFGQVFLLAVWAGAPLIDRYHPLVKRGELPKLNRPLPFAQNVSRHLVFGVALALLYQRMVSEVSEGAFDRASASDISSEL